MRVRIKGFDMLTNKIAKDEKRSTYTLDIYERLDGTFYLKYKKYETESFISRAKLIIERIPVRFDTETPFEAGIPRMLVGSKGIFKYTLTAVAYEYNPTHHEYIIYDYEKPIKTEPKILEPLDPLEDSYSTDKLDKTNLWWSVRGKKKDGTEYIYHEPLTEYEAEKIVFKKAGEGQFNLYVKKIK